MCNTFHAHLISWSHAKGRVDLSKYYLPCFWSASFVDIISFSREEYHINTWTSSWQNLTRTSRKFYMHAKTGLLLPPRNVYNTSTVTEATPLEPSCTPGPPGRPAWITCNSLDDSQVLRADGSPWVRRQVASGGQATPAHHHHQPKTTSPTAPPTKPSLY